MGPRQPPALHSLQEICGEPEVSKRPTEKIQRSGENHLEPEVRRRKLQSEGKWSVLWSLVADDRMLSPAGRAMRLLSIHSHQCRAQTSSLLWLRTGPGGGERQTRWRRRAALGEVIHSLNLYGVYSSFGINSIFILWLKKLWLQKWRVIYPNSSKGQQTWGEIQPSVPARCLVSLSLLRGSFLYFLVSTLRCLA